MAATFVLSVTIGLGSVVAGELPEYIGSAKMSADGTIELWLRAETDGIVGETVVEVAPGDPDYEDVRRHTGLEQPGQEVLVRPWPEEARTGGRK